MAKVGLFTCLGIKKKYQCKLMKINSKGGAVIPTKVVKKLSALPQRFMI
jgi:hypothetical protein